MFGQEFDSPHLHYSKGWFWLTPPVSTGGVFIMSNFDNINRATMMIYDELKEGVSAGIKRLRELGKNALADDIEEKTKYL